MIEEMIIEEILKVIGAITIMLLTALGLGVIVQAIRDHTR